MKVFEIPGKPIAWKRARRNGNRYYDAQIYDKEAYQWQLRSQHKAISCASKALSLVCEFYMPIPKSWSKGKRLNASFNFTPHTTTPDVDNYIKFIFDTFNGMLWEDDALIYQVTASKVYSDNPRTVLKLSCFDDDKPRDDLSCGRRNL